MTIDDAPSAQAPRALVSLRGPAQRAISEFLARHCDASPRSRVDRALGRSPLTAESAPWFWRAESELRVVAALDRLPHEWTVLHGVPGPRRDEDSDGSVIDHLVIGPGGVFVVTTHDHAGQNVWVGHRAFVVDGHRLQHIRAAENAVGHVERMLEAATGEHQVVTAIIAVVNPGSLQVHELPPDVSVVVASELRHWLRARERRLSPAAVRRLSAAAASDATWEDAADPEQDAAFTGAERALFERVRREVHTARAVHRAWVIGAAGLLAGSLVAVGILQLVSGTAGSPL